MKKPRSKNARHKNTTKTPKKHSKKRKICTKNPLLCLRSKNTFHQNTAEKSSKLYFFHKKAKKRGKNNSFSVKLTQINRKTLDFTKTSEQTAIEYKHTVSCLPLSMNAHFVAFLCFFSWISILTHRFINKNIMFHVKHF